MGWSLKAASNTKIQNKILSYKFGLGHFIVFVAKFTFVIHFLLTLFTNLGEEDTEDIVFQDSEEDMEDEDDQRLKELELCSSSDEGS